jgi:glycosyltransferase involved in cell wall biosynthesis
VTAVHVVVPDGIDDPARPSGGNVYDRRLCRELASLGWSVHEHAASGFWDRPDGSALAVLAGVVRGIPDGAVVLLDGLVASTAPEVLVPEARRLRLVVLVHMPLGDRAPQDETNGARQREHAVLATAAAVLTTSAWARARILELYPLAPDRVHVVPPGVDPAPLAAGTAAGQALLCVAAVTFDKGHDVLLEALTMTSDLSWTCECVGRLDRDPEFVEALRRRAVECGLGGRVQFPGPRAGAELGHCYAGADVMVLASRAETYGMVVAEALARGLPVIASAVGGVAEALGEGAGGMPPGLLIAPGDPAALAAALRAWLGDAALRTRLRRAARVRRAALSGWSVTASLVAAVLAGRSR